MLTVLSSLQRLFKILQPKTGLTLPDIYPRAPDDRQSTLLRVLSALATVLVMDHEKVAVVAEIVMGGSIEAFACTDIIAAGENSEASSANLLKNLWNSQELRSYRKFTRRCKGR